MPLLLVDLDNTLVDRAIAFKAWATSYVARLNAPAADVRWLIEVDGDGFVEREVLAEAMRDRYKLDGQSVADLVEEFRLGLSAEVQPEDGVIPALGRAAAAGWTPFIVTNGTVVQQERKLSRTGLGEHVAGWIVSEGAGIAKPDPLIFELAAKQAGQSLDGAWMVGDSGECDVAGARNAGISSVWLRRGREWSIPEFQPTRMADSCTAAIDSIIAVR
jgi:putative hydrolase of the HAD superfamily